MNGTHILEPVFHVVSPSLGRVTTARQYRGMRHNARAMAGQSAGFVSVLERLGLCRAPRILSAVCLEEEPLLNRYQ